MKIYREISLSSFEFWSGAATNAALLTETELDKIANLLQEDYPDGISETELNDLFWFDFGYIASLINETESSLEARRDEE